jgi:CRISPR system Cascade subunit CasC
MSNFIQLHVLTSYPPSNLNRDDLGRPKTAIMGGSTRLRISSQSQKRAWRNSAIFAENCGDNIGTRTKSMGIEVYEWLLEGGVAEQDAKTWAKSIAGVFGKNKASDKKNPTNELEIEQLAHFSPIEIQYIHQLVKMLTVEQREPSQAELELLRPENNAVDIAMFGRMLASSPKFNREAAVQVAHAITVHDVTVEDDFFTAVDDLNKGEEDKGAAHMGEIEFGAGLYYLYVCVDKDLLLENMGGDVEITTSALRALVEACTKVSPTGKQNSFASRAYASYLLAEKGKQQPRSLSVAFLQALKGRDIGAQAVEALENCRDHMDAVYGACADDRRSFNTFSGIGTLDSVIAFVVE